jgi:hypothetical protein
VVPCLGAGTAGAINSPAGSLPEQSPKRLRRHFASSQQVGIDHDLHSALPSGGAARKLRGQAVVVDGRRGVLSVMGMTMVG